jgi:hypothetical protein
MSSGEQYCPSGVQGSPLVTLWLLLAQVPSHRVVHRDVDCVGHKHEAALPDRYIYNLTSARWHAAHNWPSILIHNVNGGGRGMLLLRCGDACVARFIFLFTSMPNLSWLFVIRLRARYCLGTSKNDKQK